MLGLASAQASICEGQEENSLVDNDESCAHYFQCVNGVAESGVCPEPLLFDPVLHICNHADDVECEVTTFPPPIEINCYPDGIEMHPHPYSCQKYIMCFSGVQIEMECAPNLHWSIYEGFCTSQDLAECTIEKSLCPEIDDPSELVFIPSSRNCNRYYLCYNQQTIGMNCAPGKWFDPINNWCDLEENVNCEVTTTQEPELPPPIDTVECTEGLYFRPHPTTCEYFFLCANGESVLMQCAPGLKFDSVTAKCTQPDDATCVIAQPL